MCRITWVVVDILTISTDQSLRNGDEKKEEELLRQAIALSLENFKKKRKIIL